MILKKYLKILIYNSFLYNSLIIYFYNSESSGKKEKKRNSMSYKLPLNSQILCLKCVQWANFILIFKLTT